tara:strand:- start:154 stop:255 length:102 start_codon:yes stop_codon:yes gene_type:complete
VNKKIAKRKLAASSIALGLCLAGIIVIGELYSR